MTPSAPYSTKRAADWGSRGRAFKSGQPDHKHQVSDRCVKYQLSKADDPELQFARADDTMWHSTARAVRPRFGRRRYGRFVTCTTPLGVDAGPAPTAFTAVTVNV